MISLQTKENILPMSVRSTSVKFNNVNFRVDWWIRTDKFVFISNNGKFSRVVSKIFDWHVDLQNISKTYCPTKYSVLYGS